MADLYRQQWKRDTAANFTSNNPTLLSGEPALEKNTGRIKFGDGTTAWTSLAYAYPLSTRDNIQDISAADQTITLPTSPKDKDTHAFSWHSGDGSNQLIVSGTVYYGNTALDSTAKLRFGEGTGEALLQYDSNSSAWRIKSYYDKGLAAQFTNGNWQKDADGTLRQWRLTPTTGTTISVTFPLTFAATPEDVQSNINAGAALASSATSVTTTGMNIHNEASQDAWWRVTGVWF
jgi:hypothetical protein